MKSIQLKRRYLPFLTFLALLAGCGKPAQLGTPPTPAAGTTPHVVKAEPNIPLREVPPRPEARLAVVPLYYATDRSYAAGAPGSFGPARGELSYGACEVALPLDRGVKPPPSGVARLEENAQPLRGAALLRKVSPREPGTWLSRLKSPAPDASKGQLLVFVHGYGVTFAEAARRAARLKLELGFSGPVAFFSWPSAGRAPAYAADEAEVEWAQPDLKAFLKQLALEGKARNIYLVGQGMGCRALAKAFVYLKSERPDLEHLFRELILVAPDIDAALFRREIAPTLALSSCRTTLYASSNDPALRAARRFGYEHRAGTSGVDLTPFEGIHTIDAGKVSTSLTERAVSGSVLADIGRLIRYGKKPAERPGLAAAQAEAGRYWRLGKR